MSIIIKRVELYYSNPGLLTTEHSGAKAHGSTTERYAVTESGCNMPPTLTVMIFERAWDV